MDFIDALMTEPGVPWVLALLLIPGSIIGAICLTSSLAYREGGPVSPDGEDFVPYDGRNPDHAKAREKEMRGNLLRGFTIVPLGILIAALSIGWATNAHRSVLAQDPTHVTKYFLGMTDADAQPLFEEGKTVTASAIGMDGKTHDVEIRLGTSPVMSAITPVDGTDIRETFGRDFPVAIDQQLLWLVGGMAEDTYGIDLEAGQLEELRVPKALPTEPAEFGTTPVVLSLGDGEYLRLDATLIWDGEFKLVGPVESNTLTELPRKE